MKYFCIIFLLNLLSVAHVFSSNQTQYNVLFIAVDDLNDWTGFLGGHPDALTPHMDSLAESGMVFTNAHCAAPSCNPSRCAIMSGFHPWGSGIYTNPGNGREHQNLRISPVTTTAYTLPEYLSKNGIQTLSKGKIYHFTSEYNDTWDVWESTNGGYGTNLDYYGANRITWSPTAANIDETMDFQTAYWAADLLSQKHEKPFFIACGIFRPHLPWYVPELFFDRFPLDSIDMPVIDTNDLNDVIGFSADTDYNILKDDGKLRDAARAYLANVNYADSAIGVILDALKNSQYYENTIVILWGDHGWHIGEKMRYRKFTLWEEATQMPLIIRVPGITPEGSRCHEPVNLVDLYPTILSLCQLPPNTNNQGKDLTPILYGQTDTLTDYTITTHVQDNYAIRTRDWRFIRRDTGNIELYDHRIDEFEHTNLWTNPAYSNVVDSFTIMLDSILLLDSPTVETAISKHVIPGVIQAENYNRGGEGISYHDTDTANKGMDEVDYAFKIYYRNNDWVDISPCNDSGGGYHINYIEANEWLQYTISDIKKGDYKLKLRVASNNDNHGNVVVKLNNSTITTIPMTNTGGLNNWELMQSGDISLESASNAALKLEFTGSGFLLNYLKFEDADDIGVPIRDAFTNILIYQSGETIQFETDVWQNHCRISIYNLEGKNLRTEYFSGHSTQILLKPEWRNTILITRVGSHSIQTSKKILVK